MAELDALSRHKWAHSFTRRFDAVFSPSVLDEEQIEASSTVQITEQLDMTAKSEELDQSVAITEPDTDDSSMTQNTTHITEPSD